MAHTYKHKLNGKFKNRFLPKSTEPIDLSYRELSKHYPLFMLKFWRNENLKIWKSYQKTKKTNFIQSLQNEFI